MSNLDGKEMDGSQIEVSLAKPPSDKKKKEEILRARERRLLQMMHGRGGGYVVVIDLGIFFIPVTVFYWWIWIF